MPQWVVPPRCVAIWCTQTPSCTTQPSNLIPNTPIKIHFSLQPNRLVALLPPTKHTSQTRQTSQTTPKILTTYQPCTCSGLPVGLTYVRNFLSWEEQTQLLNQIDSREWSKELNRRTQQFGYKFKWNTRSLEVAGPTIQRLPRDIESVGRKAN